MSTVGLRLGVALFAFMFGVVLDAIVNTSPLVEKALAYPVKAVDSLIGTQIDVPERRELFDSKLPTEITFERIQAACFGCPIKRIVLNTKGSGNEFENAIVTELDLQTGDTRQGRLDSYYYHNLLRFIEGQGYFTMRDQYFTGTRQSWVVKSSVSVGDKYKSIITAGEGKVPSSLWGIHYAIEGVLNHVTWEDNR